VFKTTGKRKHKKTKEICTVSVLAPGSHSVSVDISRGRTIYATGTGVTRAGRARFVLHTLRMTNKTERYLVTIIATRGKHRITVRHTQRI
jgi:hypothetical protein